MIVALDVRLLVSLDRLSRYAGRCALHVLRLKWIPLGISLLLAANSCAPLKLNFTLDELTERFHYSRDTNLEELVAIAITRGYSALDGEGQGRRVLELNGSTPETVHRQFFEVQPREAGFSDAFFLENKGSVNQTDYNRFPTRLQKDITSFLEGLPEAKRGKYKPLIVQQEKLARRMIVYENGDGGEAMEFTQKVVSLERSNLYGLFHLPHGPFIFFGGESLKLRRKDFLEADDRYNHLVQEFLVRFRPRKTL